VKAKKSYHHGDLRQCLVDAAVSLINEGEIAHLSLRGVARKLGVSHNAPYRHFADKEALLSAVAAQGFQTLSCVMQEALKSMAVGDNAQLMGIGIAYVHFALKYPSHYRVMFGNYGSNTKKSTILRESGDQAFMVLVNVIKQGQEAGIFRVGDTWQMAMVAWSLVHGQAMLAIDGKLPIDGDAFEEFLQFSAQMLINGLANDK
jgi:AcrR family transcriptional regulator